MLLSNMYKLTQVWPESHCHHILPITTRVSVVLPVLVVYFLNGKSFDSESKGELRETFTSLLLHRIYTHLQGKEELLMSRRSYNSFASQRRISRYISDEDVFS